MTNYLKLNKLDELKIIIIFQKILEAINYLHEKEIIHMDIKLENIMIDRSANPKIIDFGLSIMQKDAKDQVLCGTPSYMSPEIIANKNKIGTKTDIWSAGVLLYKMLFHCYPFEGHNDKEIFLKIKKGVFTFPHPISEQLKSFISNMIEIDSDKRINSKEVKIIRL